jgi:hypothetical protein
MIEVMEKRGMAQLAGGRMFAWAIDMKHLVENAPRRADMILEKLATNQMTARLEVNDLDRAARTMKGAVNRLSLGMIASSLIIGGGYVLGALIKRDTANR